ARRLLDLLLHPRPDARLDDPFELFAPARIAEHDRGELAAVDRALVVQHLQAEPAGDLVARLGFAQDRVAQRVAVDDGGPAPRELGGDGALAAADAADE